MKNWTLILLFVCSIHVGSAQDKTLPRDYLKDSMPQLVNKARGLLEHAYMTGELLQTTDTMPGWEGFPVKLYSYQTGKDIHSGNPKKGLVYLLNPSPEKLAMWIVTTCWEVKNSLDYQYTEQLFQWIKHQSGAQFPVKGIVYEDQYVKGFYEPYLFKDGVTVYVKDTTSWPEDKTCTAAQLRYYLQVKNEELNPQTGQYARISSTTREDYANAGGKVAVGDKSDRRLAWLAVVRELYKRAWNSDRNELMIMWAKAHLK